MRRRFLIIVLTCLLATFLFAGFTSKAETGQINTSTDSKQIYITESHDFYYGAELISTETKIVPDGKIVTRTYRLPDGNIATDILEIKEMRTRSANGSDTVSRTISITNWGSITIEATFIWYESGIFSYVRCSSMTATHNLRSNVSVSEWSTSYTSDPVAIGDAKAQVNYHFYQTDMPTQFKKGKFYISCSDTGTISDGT